MLQKTFSIYGDEIENTQFFIEIGRKHIACFSKNISANALTALEFFQLDEYDVNEFDTVLYEVKNNSRLFTTKFETTNLVWNTAECICIPKTYSEATSDHDFFNLMYGEKQETTLFADAITDCMVVARIDNHLINSIRNYFPDAHYFHQFYFLIKNIQHKNREGNAIHLVFYPDYFTILASKNSQLQLIQTIAYNTPEEVLYFTLNVQQQYQMVPEDTIVEAYGFIVQGSALYTILMQYLQHFSIVAASAENFAAEGFAENPFHFFQHFLNYDPS